MGNCWSGFVAELAKIRRPIDYIGRTHQARSARYNVRDRGDGIEFDNLLSEDEYEIDTTPQPKVLTDEECTFINQKRYGDLVKKQKTINAQIDKKLQKHEENIRLEEEAEYAAKREAAKAAKQARQQKQAKSNPSDQKIQTILDDSAFTSWLSDEEDEQEEDHDLDTKEFEEMLAKLKQTSYNSGLNREEPSGSNTTSQSDKMLFDESLAKDLEATTIAGQSIEELERWSPTFDDD